MAEAAKERNIAERKSALMLSNDVCLCSLTTLAMMSARFKWRSPTA
jgi:hypothetical protein